MQREIDWRWVLLLWSAVCLMLEGPRLGRRDVGMAFPTMEEFPDMNLLVSSEGEASRVVSLEGPSWAVCLAVAPEFGLQHTY